MYIQAKALSEKAQILMQEYKQIQDASVDLSVEGTQYLLPLIEKDKVQIQEIDKISNLLFGVFKT
ncbi:MAG: hypothetical protein Q9M43_07220 [Sulfurimonas sp.]|nr:hypothetical protein [Sulfurimonas sp.]